MGAGPQPHEAWSRGQLDTQTVSSGLPPKTHDPLTAGFCSHSLGPPTTPTFVHRPFVRTHMSLDKRGRRSQMFRPHAPTQVTSLTFHGQSKQALERG